MDSDQQQNLTFEQLPDLRAKTECVAQFLEQQLRAYLDTLRPLLLPSRLAGTYDGGKYDGEDKPFRELQAKYRDVCGKPFDLSPDVEQGAFREIGGRLEIYPWEYGHEIGSDGERKRITVTSPLRWVLAYNCGLSLADLRVVLGAKDERRTREIHSFVLNALVIALVVQRQPGIARLLADLRFDVAAETAPDLGRLPLVTISACLGSFRPEDSLLLAVTRISGVPAFIELIDVDEVSRMRDPLKEKIAKVLERGHSDASRT